MSDIIGLNTKLYGINNTIVPASEDSGLRTAQLEEEEESVRVLNPIVSEAYMNGAISGATGSILPTVSSTDAGDVLMVNESGQWAKGTISGGGSNLVNINLSDLTAINSATIDGNTVTLFFTSYSDSVSLTKCYAADVTSYISSIEDGGWINFYTVVSDVFTPNTAGFSVGEFTGNNADTYPDGGYGVGTTMPYIMVDSNCILIPTNFTEYMVAGTVVG